MDQYQIVERLRETVSLKGYVRNGGKPCCPSCQSDKLTVERDGRFWSCPDCGEGGDVIDAMRLALGTTRDAIIAEECKRLTGSDETPFEMYQRECVERFKGSNGQAFLKGLGISDRTAARFGIGYDPGRLNQETGGLSECLIVPTSNKRFFTIDINDRRVIYDDQDIAPEVFNIKAILKARVVFVTESIFDALAINEAEAQAIALESSDGMNALFDAILKAKDNGQKVASLCLCGSIVKKNTLTAELKNLGVRFVTAELSTVEFKTPGDFLIGNRNEFFETVRREEVKASTDRPDNIADYMNSIMYLDMKKFRNGIKTGFPTVDRLTSGLYTGLYVLAAISSLGKTTLAVQMAEQIAKGGNDVLFFSLEQSKLELVSKGIARRTIQPNGSGRDKGVSNLKVRSGFKNEKVDYARELYLRDVGNRFSIVEGNFGCSVDSISKYIKKYIRNTGVRPVVFIDYLQVIKPDASKKQTTKDATDQAITDLKCLSRDYDLTIVVISSVNRANYLVPIAFESLKESGGIEYTADVVLGMQLQCLTTNPVFEKEKEISKKREIVNAAKNEKPRKIELTCLKNRFGTGFSVYFDYYSEFDLIVDRGEPPKQDDPTGFTSL